VAQVMASLSLLPSNMGQAERACGPVALDISLLTTRAICSPCEGRAAASEKPNR